MKKPKEMIEGFRDLYIPGTFAVHLKAKGAHLLKLSEDFLAYKKTLLLGVEESLLKNVGELCSPPNLDKENLIAEVLDLDNKKILS